MIHYSSAVLGVNEQALVACNLHKLFLLFIRILNIVFIKAVSRSKVSICRLAVKSGHSKNIKHFLLCIDSDTGHTCIYLYMHRELHALAYGIITELLRILHTSGSLGNAVFKQFVKIIFISITECQYCARYAVLTELFTLPQIRNTVIFYAEILEFKTYSLIIMTVGIRFHHRKYLFALCKLLYLIIVMCECIEVDLSPRAL